MLKLTWLIGKQMWDSFNVYELEINKVNFSQTNEEQNNEGDPVQDKMESFNAFKMFSTCCKRQSQSYKQFINNFERLYYAFQEAYPKELPISILALKLLSKAKLNKTQKDEIITQAGGLDYKRVRSALLQLDNLSSASDYESNDSYEDRKPVVKYIIHFLTIELLLHYFSNLSYFNFS